MAKNQGISTTDAQNAVKDLQRDFDMRIDAIREELKKGPEAAESVERSLSDLKTGIEDRLDSMRNNLEDARESFDGAIEKGRTTIKDRPLMAVGVAVGVGLLIGLIFGRSRSHPSMDEHRRMNR
jgi:ElaB/YqjD/DUF883 family membrane-anchored ribosome-binding protein